jgi:hypothetical protein
MRDAPFMFTPDVANRASEPSYHISKMQPSRDPSDKERLSHCYLTRGVSQNFVPSPQNLLPVYAHMTDTHYPKIRLDVHGAVLMHSQIKPTTPDHKF